MNPELDIALESIRRTLFASGVDTAFMSDTDLRETIYRAHRSANFGQSPPAAFVLDLLKLVERKRSTYE